MGGTIWFTKAQMRLISPPFPLSHRVPCVDDRRVVSGIAFVVKSGLHWRDAPTTCGPQRRRCVSFRPNTHVCAQQAAAALR
jgi:transposase